MDSSAPTLETERLILRPFRLDDLDAHAAILSDAEVIRYVSGEPVTREDAWRRLLAGVGMWSLIGCGPWAVELRSDGRLVGQCGFFQFNRDITPSILGEPEMGWIFDRSVHGQGVAFEACRAALTWADQALESQSYPAIIDPENRPSMKLAERLGFVREADGNYRGQAIAFFRRSAGSV